MKYIVLGFILIIFINAQAESKSEPLWEYGLGFGYVQYEHYPASDQYAYLTLPFPTFQYRGRILRADDRDGTRAYLLTSEIWSLELSGAGNFSLDASDNKARQGMPNLPWMIMLGPQLVGRFTKEIELRVGGFQAISTDFSLTKVNGGVLDIKLLHRWDLEKGKFFIAYLGRTASKEYMETYYDVESRFALVDRPIFSSRGGFLSHELQVFKSYELGKLTFYAGATLTDYSNSINKLSPLHKSDRTVSYVIGITHLLGESEERSVPVEDTRGIINKGSL